MSEELSTTTQPSKPPFLSADQLGVDPDGLVALATIVLVLVTTVYVWLTRRAANANAEAVEVAKQSLNAEREYQQQTLELIERQHNQQMKSLKGQGRRQLRAMEQQHRVLLAQLLESMAPDVVLKPVVAPPLKWRGENTLLGEVGVRPAAPSYYRIDILVENEGPTRIYVSVDAGVAGLGSQGVHCSGCRVKPGESETASIRIRYNGVLAMADEHRSLWIDVVVRPSLGGIEDRYRIYSHARQADLVPSQDEQPGGIPARMVLGKIAHPYLRAPLASNGERSYPALGTTEDLGDSWLVVDLPQAAEDEDPEVDDEGAVGEPSRGVDAT